MDKLLLLSGNDIPFAEAKTIIHTPSIKEISFIGEENFYKGCNFLTFSKDYLDQSAREELKDKDDLEILLALLRGKDINLKKDKIAVMLVLSLLFPNNSIDFKNKVIELKKDSEVIVINGKNFISFRNILNELFCLKHDLVNEYNPVGDLSKKIAEKLKEGNRKRQELKGEQKPKKINILERYSSILSIGTGISLKEIMNYSVFQLYDAYKRFVLKYEQELYIKLKLMGGTELQEPENWEKDLYDSSEI